MDFFNLLTMLGGLALFLYGMSLMGDGLAKLSGGKLENILAKLTDNPLKAVLLGAGVTAVIQSSSATTVMVVGFVNSGIMKLHQVVGIIMGANVGTTITSWILSLSGIESDDFFVRLLKPSSFSPVLALIGIILFLFSKKERKKEAGSIFIGFAILMFGMETMSGAVESLKDVPEFTRIMTMFTNPFLGMLAGALLTAVIQSSSASVGILQALCATGSLQYGTVLPVIMGQNIGTCATALISAIGAGKNAKRAAFIHLYFNVLGTVLFMTVFYLLHAIRPFAFLSDAAGPAGIALIHSLFNIGAAVVLFPFSAVLEKLAILSVREGAEEDEEERVLLHLDERFLDNPSFALLQCNEAGIRMSELAKTALNKAISLVKSYDENMFLDALALEERVDHYEDAIGSYLLRLPTSALSQNESVHLLKLQQLIGDLERVTDLSISIARTVWKMQKKKQSFSTKASRELNMYMQAVADQLDMAIKAFWEEDQEIAQNILPLAEGIEQLDKELKKRHKKRLRKGKCSVDMGFVLADISSYLRQIAAHCNSIGTCILREGEEQMEWL